MRRDTVQRAAATPVALRAECLCCQAAADCPNDAPRALLIVLMMLVNDGVDPRDIVRELCPVHGKAFTAGLVAFVVDPKEPA